MEDFHLTVLILLRWVHLISAMLWVGTSFFTNFVLSPALKKSPAALKTDSWPEILERTAFWLRWSSLAAYVTGWLYLIYKCYGESNVGFHGPNGLAHTTWGQWISVGVILGTTLVGNVWFVIWPAQKKILGWLKAGVSGPQVAAMAAHAQRIGKINVYLVLPLIFTMGAASHLPIFNVWIVAGMLAGGFALAAHLFMIANRIYRAHSSPGF